MDITNTIQSVTNKVTNKVTQFASKSTDDLLDLIGGDQPEGAAALREVLASFDTAMLLTNLDATICGRPMSVAAYENGNMWFITGAQSPKVMEIVNDANALVTLQSTRMHAVVQGHAELVHDAARMERLWSPLMDAWFPDGPTSKDAVLVKFVPGAGQYWNMSGTKGVRFAAHMAEALAKGETVRPVPGAEGTAVL